MSAASGSSSARPNFFELLELAPDAPWNQAEFERIVMEKRREWTKSSLQGVGPKALMAKRNLGLIGEINRVMNDVSLRDKEAKERRLTQGQAKQTLLDDFKEALRFAELKTYILDSEISRWAREYAAIFPGGEADIRPYVKAPIRSSRARAAARPQIDPVPAKEIREQLQLLGYETLYELLSKELHASFSETTSLAVLQQAADRLNREQQRQANKTVQVTARIKLSGHAKVIFGSEDQRQRYRETLRQEKMTQLLKRFENYCAGAQAIDATQSENFLSEAKKLGWDVEEAKERLVDLAAQRKWPLSFSDDAAAKLAEQQRCVYCGDLNRKEARYCKTCQRKLRVECPDCGKDASLAETLCIYCGFPVGNFYPIQEVLQTLVDKDGHLLASLELEEAQDIVAHLKQAWAPKNPDALASQIAGLWAEIQRQFTEQKRLLEQILQLIARRHFCEASDLLSSPNLPSAIQSVPDWQAKQQEIKERIEAARRQVDRAKQRGAREDEQERFYWAALRESADCEEARAGLKGITPKPPWELKLEEKDGPGVLLTWRRSPSPGAEHVVVRTTHSPPTVLADGEIVGSIPSPQPHDTTPPPDVLTFSDTRPPIGVPIFYAVFARREGVSSRAGVQAAQSAFFMQEVTDLKQEVSNISVKLTWEPPLNVHSITVVRKEGSAPQSLSDGVVLRLPVGQTNSLLDKQVQEGRRYFYRVYCHFLNSQGRPVSSHGSQPVIAIPQGPPDPRKLNPTFTFRQAQISLWLDISWTPPEKGKVIILKSDHPLQLDPEKVYEESDEKRYSKVPNEGKADLRSPPDEQYYVPAILFQGSMYVGEEKRFAYTRPLTHLKAYNLVTVLALEWAWPDDASEVQIGYDTTNWPKDVQSASRKVVVTRKEYDSLGRYELKVPGGMQYYILVAPVVIQPVVIQQGKRIVGNGVQVSCYLGTKTRVDYWFERNRSHHKLILQARQPVILPPLQIRTQVGSSQMTRTDGTFWHSLTLAAHPRPKWEIDLPPAYFPPSTYGRLFLEDEADECRFDLIPTSHDRLKLS